MNEYLATVFGEDDSEFVGYFDSFERARQAIESAIRVDRYWTSAEIYRPRTDTMWIYNSSEDTWNRVAN